MTPEICRVRLSDPGGSGGSSSNGREVRSMLRGIVILTLALLLRPSREAMGRPNGDALPDSGDARSPRGAMLRSLALPGWGQFYNRHYVKGGAIAALEVGSATVYFLRRSQIHRQQALSPGPRRNLFAYTTILIVVYSMADAYVDAHLDSNGMENDRSGPEDRGMKVALRVKF